MALSTLARLLPRKFKLRLKTQYARLKSLVVTEFFSYGPRELQAALARLGIVSGDTLLVHSAFDKMSGFRGQPLDLIDTLISTLGERGNLLMMSMTYTGTTRQYLSSGKPFRVNRTVSRMGIVTEVFRRRPDVVRSLNPAHPIVVRGPDAQQIIAHHDRCEHSCGIGSPMERFHKLGGKILFFNVPFNTITFVHYLEDLFRDSLPMKLYTDDPLEATVVDEEGSSRQVKVYAFSDEETRWRNTIPLECELMRSAKLRLEKIGRTRLMTLKTSDAVTCVDKMIQDGKGLYPSPQ